MKKDSGASLTSKPQLEAHSFFLDRCLGKTKVATKLREFGLIVEVHADHFPETEHTPEVHDATWLREVGRRGWVILSKDNRFDKRQVEIRALLESGAPAFVLTSGEATANAMADSFIAAMPSILRILQHKSPPFIASVTASGAVKMFLTHAEIIKLIGPSE